MKGCKKNTKNPYQTNKAGKIVAPNPKKNQPRGSRIENGGDLRCKCGR